MKTMDRYKSNITWKIILIVNFVNVFLPNPIQATVALSSSHIAFQNKILKTLEDTSDFYGWDDDLFFAKIREQREVPSSDSLHHLLTLLQKTKSVSSDLQDELSENADLFKSETGDHYKRYLEYANKQVQSFQTMHDDYQRNTLPQDASIKIARVNNIMQEIYDTIQIMAHHVNRRLDSLNPSPASLRTISPKLAKTVDNKGWITPIKVPAKLESTTTTETHVPMIELTSVIPSLMPTDEQTVDNEGQTTAVKILAKLVETMTEVPVSITEVTSGVDLIQPRTNIDNVTNSHALPTVDRLTALYKHVGNAMSSFTATVKDIEEMNMQYSPPNYNTNMTQNLTELTTVYTNEVLSNYEQLKLKGLDESEIEMLLLINKTMQTLNIEVEELYQIMQHDLDIHHSINKLHLLQEVVKQFKEIYSEIITTKNKSETNLQSQETVLHNASVTVDEKIIPVLTHYTNTLQSSQTLPEKAWVDIEEAIKLTKDQLKAINNVQKQTNFGKALQTDHDMSEILYQQLERLMTVIEIINKEVQTLIDNNSYKLNYLNDDAKFNFTNSYDKLKEDFDEMKLKCRSYKDNYHFGASEELRDLKVKATNFLHQFMQAKQTIKRKYNQTTIPDLQDFTRSTRAFQQLHTVITEMNVAYNSLFKQLSSAVNLTAALSLSFKKKINESYDTSFPKIMDKYTIYKNYNTSNNFPVSVWEEIKETVSEARNYIEELQKIEKEISKETLSSLAMKIDARDFDKVFTNLSSKISGYKAMAVDVENMLSDGSLAPATLKAFRDEKDKLDDHFKNVSKIYEELRDSNGMLTPYQWHYLQQAIKDSNISFKAMASLKDELEKEEMKRIAGREEKTRSDDAKASFDKEFQKVSKNFDEYDDVKHLVEDKLAKGRFKPTDHKELLNRVNDLNNETLQLSKICIGVEDHYTFTAHNSSIIILKIISDNIYDMINEINRLHQDVMKKTLTDTENPITTEKEEIETNLLQTNLPEEQTNMPSVFTESKDRSINYKIFKEEFETTEISNVETNTQLGIDTEEATTERSNQAIINELQHQNSKEPSVNEQITTLEPSEITTEMNETSNIIQDKAEQKAIEIKVHKWLDEFTELENQINTTFEENEQHFKPEFKNYFHSRLYTIKFSMDNLIRKEFNLLNTNQPLESLPMLEELRKLPAGAEHMYTYLLLLQKRMNANIEK